MNNKKDIAIKVEGIGKYYRIGAKEEVQDNLLKTALNVIRSPLKNYKKYRALYNFDDITCEADFETRSVIQALKDVSFTVEKGEVLGIIGQNGAGKSTLLKILARITDPTFGRAEIRGRVSSLLEVGTGFHPELTGRENVYLNGTILGMRKVEIDRKFDEIVDFSGISKFIDTPVKRYSSGMRVRLAFSVAAYMEPEILIIDEVLAVGDAEFQSKCLSKMEDIGQHGRTVLFVSHNMPAVSRLCSRAICLWDGRLTDDGPADKVVWKYLQGDSNSTASVFWENPRNAPTGEYTRLRSVRIVDENNRELEVIDIRKQFYIEMGYEVMKGGRIMMPHFGLNNQEGQTLFVTIDQDQQWRGKPRQEGFYKSRVCIPGNLLTEGPHFVNCHMLLMNPDSVEFSEKSVAYFTIVDRLEGDSARGDYARNIPGFVRPLLNWTTQYEPAGVQEGSGDSNKQYLQI